MNEVAVIDYNAGNTQSVLFTLQRLGIVAKLTSDHEEIRAAEKVIFPGVGEARRTMAHLQEQGLDILIPTLKQPVLGICLGLQIMCNHTEEYDTSCLGIFDVNVKKFKFEAGHKVPHMGWNTIHSLKTPVFDISDQSYCYFVHSYFAEISDYTIAVCDYRIPFSAALQKDNFYAVQFHPEKSGTVGAQIIQNFIQL